MRVVNTIFEPHPEPIMSGSGSNARMYSVYHFHYTRNQRKCIFRWHCSVLWFLPHNLPVRHCSRQASRTKPYNFNYLRLHTSIDVHKKSVSHKHSQFTFLYDGHCSVSRNCVGHFVNRHFLRPYYILHYVLWDERVNRVLYNGHRIF